MPVVQAYMILKNMHEITILWLELPLLLLQAVDMSDKHSKLHCVILTVHPSILGLTD